MEYERRNGRESETHLACCKVKERKRENERERERDSERSGVTI